MPRSLSPSTTWLVIASVLATLTAALLVDVGQVDPLGEGSRAILTRGSWSVLAALVLFTGGRRV